MQYFGFDRPSFALRTLGFGANFNPLDLFKDGKQGVWYDPSDKSTLFQDVAGTVPVTKDGDPVALMRDKSGNNNHATQTVSTARPIYRTDGDLHWLRFDGVDDSLHRASLTLGRIYSSDAYYLCTACSAEGRSSIVYLTDSMNTADRKYSLDHSITGDLGVCLNGIQTRLTDTSTETAVRGVIKQVAEQEPTAVIGGSRSGLAETIQNAEQTFRNFYLGSRPDGNVLLKGNIYSLIMVVGGLDVSKNIQQALTYQNSKAGVTL